MEGQGNMSHIINVQGRSQCAHRTRIKIYLDVENLLLYLKLTGNSLWLALNHRVIPTNLHYIDLHRVRLGA